MKRILGNKTVLVIALIYTATLLAVSLLRVGAITSGVHIPYADKIFHFFAYIGLTLLWHLYYFRKYPVDQIKPNFWICVIVALFGVLIEVLQAALTTYRHLEDLDFLANISGILLAVVILFIYNRLHKKNVL